MRKEQNIRVLLVDDDELFIKGKKERLATQHPQWTIETAQNRTIALKKIQEAKELFGVAAIDMDMYGDHEAGLKFIQEVNTLNYPPICIVMTGHGGVDNASKCMAEGALAYVEKGLVGDATLLMLTEAIKKAAEHFLLRKVSEDAFMSFVSSRSKDGLIRVNEQADPFTYGHSDRVALWSKAIGQEMGLGAGELLTLERGAGLHEIGKIRLSPTVRAKPGKRTAGEDNQFKTHPQKGYELVGKVPGINDDILGIIQNHCEYSDGSGFPCGIKDYDIPMLAKIVSVANEYDKAFSPPHDRAFRHPDEAGAVINRMAQKGKLDQVIVDLFLCIQKTGDSRLDDIDDRKDLDELFGQAKREVRIGKLEEAGNLCNQIIAKVEQEEEHDKARQLKLAAYCLAIGDLFRSHHKYDWASSYYTRALEAHPGNAETFFKRGQTREAQEMWEDAELDYLIASEIIPTYIDAHLARAKLLIKFRLFSQAQEICYNILNSLDKCNSKANYILGQIFYAKWRQGEETEKKEEALCRYLKAVECDSTHIPAHLALARIYVHDAEYDKANENYSHVLEELDKENNEALDGQKKIEKLIENGVKGKI